MKGKTNSKGFRGFPNNRAPRSAAANTNTNCPPMIWRFSVASTCEKRTPVLSHEKLGVGIIPPKTAKNIRAMPKRTTTQSSLIITRDLEDDILLSLRLLSNDSYYMQYRFCNRS